MTPDLFPDAPRRPRRVLMHVEDVYGGCEAEPPYQVTLKCPKCGHTEDRECRSATEARSQPCPVCNKGAVDE